MDPDTIHKITRGEIEHILRCLRSIDRARESLVQQSAAVADIDELRKSADGIYRIVKKLPES